MNTDIKIELRSRARLLNRLVTLLKYDVEFITTDILSENWDNLNKDIRETRSTMDSILDTITEIEYLGYIHTDRKA